MTSPNYAPSSKPWESGARKPPRPLARVATLVTGTVVALASGSMGVVIGRHTAGGVVDEPSRSGGRRAARERGPDAPGTQPQAGMPERQGDAVPLASSRAKGPDERSQELARWRHEAAAAQRALDAANQRVQALEARRERRSDPRDFDLGPDDWRRLARQGTLELRVPCGGQAGDLSPAQLEKSGLEAGDGPIIATALKHSTDRMWAQLGPLCARALGGSVDEAARVGLRDCRHRVLDQGMKDGTALAAYRRAAAYLAGDAPEPTGEAPVEQLVIAMAREQRLIVDELAQHFGPDEAERLVFSRTLCFTEATHELGGQTAATGAPDSPAEGSGG